MSESTTANARASFDLKGATLPLTAVVLKTTDLVALAGELDRRLGDVPDFFDQDPVLIDLALIQHEVQAVNFPSLLALLREHRMVPIAVRGGNADQTSAARAAGLGVAPDAPSRAPFGAGRDAGRSAPQADSPVLTDIIAPGPQAAAAGGLPAHPASPDPEAAFDQMLDASIGAPPEHTQPDVDDLPPAPPVQEPETRWADPDSRWTGSGDSGGWTGSAALWTAPGHREPASAPGPEQSASPAQAPTSSAGPATVAAGAVGQEAAPTSADTARPAPAEDGATAPGHASAHAPAHAAAEPTRAEASAESRTDTRADTQAETRADTRAEAGDEPDAGPSLREIIQELPVVNPGTVVIDKPLRSGQQVYARNADLVVLAMVSFGAEVMADGNVHVYAPLRGRALAGVRGNLDARIFTTCLEPQLVSIAGIYRTSEVALPEEVAGKPAQIRLVGEKLLIEPL